MKNKSRTKSATRAFCITLIVIFCLCGFALGVAKSYESILKIGFGEYKRAFDAGDGYIRILDFEITF